MTTTTQPYRCERDPWLFGLIGIIGAVLSFYVAAGPHLYDAGELVAAAWSLGGSHAPGQPLHALLGHLFARIPLGPIPARIALLSVAGVMAALYLAASITAELLKGMDINPLWIRVASMATVLAAVASGPVIRQTTRVEVYTLALALTLYASLQLLRWGSAPDASATHLLRAALAAGLASCVHPPHGLAAFLVGLAVTLLCRIDIFRRWRILLLTLLCGVAGLACYAYLPARATTGAPMWGDPLTAKGLLDYISAAAYRQNLGGRGASPLLNAWHVGQYYIIAAGVAPVVGVVALILRAKRRIALAAVLASILTILSACLQPLEIRNPDNVAYLASAVVLLICTGAAGFALLSKTRLRMTAFGGLLVLAFNLPALSSILRSVKSDIPVLETLAGSLLDTPPPRALVVTFTDYVLATWLMARETEGARPDVALFISGLSTSSWHWASLAQHPVFDGHPIRGTGTDSHMRYLNGALRYAQDKVPIFLERDVPGFTPNHIAGPYLVRWTEKTSTQEVLLKNSAGERLVHTIAQDAMSSPPGDMDTASAIVRDYEINRAHRLMAAKYTGKAFQSLERAIYPLSAKQKHLLQNIQGQPQRPAPPVVKDPTAYLTSRGDAVRETAVYLWTLDLESKAKALLQDQAQAGDARALLQLAWFQISEGHLDKAAHTVDIFIKSAPDLADGASWLVGRLSITPNG